MASIIPGIGKPTGRGTLFYPYDQLLSIPGAVDGLPHIKAQNEGRLLSGNSLKPVHLHPDKTIVTKVWGPSYVQRMQLALTELRARILAQEMKRVLDDARIIDTSLDHIVFPDAICYEAPDEAIVLVTDYFPGKPMRPALVRNLPIELSAMVALISRCLGISQFHPSSLLIDETASKVGCIDLEDSFDENNPDFETRIVYESLSTRGCGKINQFNDIVKRAGKSWVNLISRERYQKHLTRLMILKNLTVPGTQKPKEVVGSLCKIASVFERDGFVLPGLSQSLVDVEQIGGMELFTSLIDMKKALVVCSGDKSLLKVLILAFIEESYKGLGRAATALLQQDTVSLKREGHTLKGSLGYFAYPESEIYITAKNLESAGAKGDVNEAGLLVAKLNELLPDFVKALSFLHNNLTIDV